MKFNIFGVSAAAAALASIAVLPTLAFAQYYSYPSYQNQNYATQAYGSYYTPSYSYGTNYPYNYSYGTPSIYISTGGDVYGGDYIPSINGSFSNAGYGYGTYGSIPTMGTYAGGYGYPQNYNYGYNTYPQNYSYGYSQPYAYGYNPYQNAGYDPYYGNSGYYSACSANVGGVCGQDTSIGLGAALYHTILPYNYSTGL